MFRNEGHQFLNIFPTDTLGTEISYAVYGNLCFKLFKLNLGHVDMLVVKHRGNMYVLAYDLLFDQSSLFCATDFRVYGVRHCYVAWFVHA